MDKLSIGNIVHIPYRDHTRGPDGNGLTDAATFKVLDPQEDAGSNVSSNRIGDRRIFGTFTRTGGSISVRHTKNLQILPHTSADDSIYDFVTVSYTHLTLPTKRIV